MPQLIGVPRETAPGEKRVATVPEVVERLVKLGFRVAVQAGAGDDANFADDTYRAAGAEIGDDAARLWASADIIFKVRPPELDEVVMMREGATLVSFIWPAQHPMLMQALAGKRATVLAMDSVPRISRAQKLDALSSMANIAGYRAVIEAAHHFGRFFTGQITAAGKVPPAKVFIIGAGVAGLAAIGAAVGLGAIVRANDTRPEVADQVKSLGAEFIGAYAPATFLEHFTVFVLACFVGYMVIWNVTPALHTPLMSVTNAISSIITIGALVQVAPPVAEAGGRPTTWIIGLAVISIALVAINMFGGFAVTQRMLQMFRK